MMTAGIDLSAINHALFARGIAQPNAASGTVTGFSSSDLRQAFIALPLFVAMACYTIMPLASLDMLLLSGLGLAGMSLVLLAAHGFGVSNQQTGRLALLLYSAALAAAAVHAGADNSVVWMMVLALPVEFWLLSRSRQAVIAGILVVSAVMISVFLTGFGAQNVLPAGLSTIFLLAYVSALLLRMLVKPANNVKAQAQQHHPAQDADLETALNALVIRLDQDGHIRTVSDQCVAQFGVERAVLNGTLLLDRVHVGDRVHYLALLNGLKNGSPAMHLSSKATIRLRCVNREAQPDEQDKIYFTPYEMEGRSAKAGEGTLDGGLLLVARNSSGAEHAQNQLSQQSTTIENLEVSRSRLLGTVSHELRTPLNSIIGFSDLLLHDVAGPLHSAKQREYIDLIRKSGTHLLEVVNSILEASRLESGHYPVHYERFALRDSVTMCNAMLMPLAEKKGVILCDRIHPLVEEMVGDRRAIQQILINLVTNAIKFTDRGGCVTIDVMPQQPQSRLGTAPQQLVIAVSDTGIGLDSDEIKRLCQPFTQINNVNSRLQEGSGLGLYLVKGLVDLHHGQLDIRSRKGQGTTVSVQLPLQQAVDNKQSGAVETELPANNRSEVTPIAIDAALQQVKAAIINLQAEQAESSYDGKTEPQWLETQGKFHAQNRKTA